MNKLLGAELDEIFAEKANVMVKVGTGAIKGRLPSPLGRSILEDQGQLVHRDI